MSNYDINKMDYKQLRNEVQLLRDELAIMKRMFEDIIYNLDTDNFSQRIVKQGKDMYTKIEQTAEEISLQAEKIGENSKNIASLEITADEISSEVFYVDENGEKQSAITQTAEEISLQAEKIGENSKNIASLEITADEISSEVFYVDENGEKQSAITQTANDITLEVQKKYETKDDAQNNYAELESKITVEKNRVSAVISGVHTDDMLKDYFTGIEITPDNIKMMDDNVYSIYSSEGLRFYDSQDQAEGWAIEPDATYGGVLNYYINDTNSYIFGTGATGTGYATTDMVIKAVNKKRGRFVVDVTSSTYPEVKFVGLNDNSSLGNEPCIYANEMLLATQEWVLANGGGGTVTAVFA